MIRQSSMAIGEVQIATWRTGQDGPLVMFLPGGLCDHRSWIPQLEALGSRYRCVAIDPRGCGWSTTAGPYDIEQQAQDVAIVIEAQARGPAVVISHSIGGYAALLLIHSRPELVTANVFIDVPLSEGGANTTRTVQSLQTAQSLSPLSGMVESMGMLADDEVKATIQAMMLTRPVDVAIGMLSQLEAVTNNLGYLFKEAARKPCLVIWPGPQPRGGDPAWVARTFPGVRQELVRHTGHFVQLERPDAVNPLIDRFLAGSSNSALGE